VQHPPAVDRRTSHPNPRHRRRRIAGTGQRGHLNQRHTGRTSHQYELLRGLITAATAACLFWSASNYAEVQGDLLAHDFADQASSQVAVFVYSTDPLHIDAPGVRTDIVGPEQTSFRFRYTGLRMMDRRGGKYFLVPANWTLAQGVVIVLPDDGRIRLEFVRG
jgi:hypothetical protein